RLLQRAVEVLLDLRVAREVGVDEILRLPGRDVQLVREAERRHAVQHAEVDRLRGAALVGRQLTLGDVEHLRGRGAMDVRAALERLDEGGGLRGAREEAELSRRTG